MSSKFYLLLLSLCYFKVVNLSINISNTSEELPSNLIESWVAKPLTNIKHLHLQLRSNHFQKDIESPYIQWFLKQTLVSITIGKYELNKNKTNVMTTNYERNNYVIVTSMESLRLTARQFSKRAGVFFFIVSGVIDYPELRDIFQLGWKHLQIFNNFLLTDKNVLIYDPFELDEFGNYGKIITYSGKETIERTIFYDMRGYPLRVQLFRSVYSKPLFDPITHKIQNVDGVDGRVANLLQQQMNFTMVLQDPDPNYFG